MNYTYEPSEPELYDGKRFLIRPETGDPFIVSTLTGESEIPELVEHHLNPPPSSYTPLEPEPMTFQPPMQSVLDVVKELQAKIEQLEKRVIALEGTEVWK